ncbi:unnamed protein product [Linum trigynum]|uniref:Uncharacterized protein n=1 Tax=Linum trigynum TaxID=586398 RepID=A0AAV2EFZ7_9ROSI
MSAPVRRGEARRPSSGAGIGSRVLLQRPARSRAMDGGVLGFGASGLLDQETIWTLERSNLSLDLYERSKLGEPKRRSIGPFPLWITIIVRSKCRVRD